MYGNMRIIHKDISGSSDVHLLAWGSEEYLYDLVHYVVEDTTITEP